MPSRTNLTSPGATAIAHPNIAFIKYWGNRDDALRLPSNGSLSINLEGLYTRTQVTYDPKLRADSLVINNKPSRGPALTRVSEFLNLVRQYAGIKTNAAVISSNNYPMGAGIASSAAAFAALALAASSAAGLTLNEPALSRLARRGSGSACRSIPGGFVEWQMGEKEEDCYAFSIAPANHWNIVDCVAVVSHAHKTTGSTEGHGLAATSPLQIARVADAPRRIGICRKAILEKDFIVFAEVVEQDCNMMHAVMMTSHPALLYWQPGTLAVMRAVAGWRAAGLPVCYTIDAGPNVHVLCLAESVSTVQRNLAALPGVEQVLIAPAGGPARLVNDTEG